MFELDRPSWDRVLPGLRTLPLNTLFIQSVLRGHIGGEVFSDGRAFYAVHPYGMSLLWGDSQDAGWIDFLRGRLLRPAGPPEWLQVWPETWSNTVRASLGERLREFTRVNFRFDRQAYVQARVDPAPGVTILPTDEAMFTRLDGSVVPRHFWPDAAQFVRQGGGFSAFVDGELAATAFCSFRHGPQLELGIETSARYRGKGLGRQVACALIDFCLRQDLEPVWACRLENEASFQLARKLGFVPSLHLPYFQLGSP